MLRMKTSERLGFEPRMPFGITVFETAALDHSATSPETFNILRRILRHKALADPSQTALCGQIRHAVWRRPLCHLSLKSKIADLKLETIIWYNLPRCQTP